MQTETSENGMQIDTGDTKQTETADSRLLYDKIPSEEDWKVEGKNVRWSKVAFRNAADVKTQYAKQLNIFTLITGLLLLTLGILGFFLPVAETAYINGGFIVDSVTGEKEQGHYMKIRQSGLQLCLSGIYANSSKSRQEKDKAKVKNEYNEAVAKAEIEYTLWSAAHPLAEKGARTKAAERIYSKHLQNVNYTYYLCAVGVCDEIDCLNALAAGALIFVTAAIGSTLTILSARALINKSNTTVAYHGCGSMTGLLLLNKFLIPFGSLNVFYLLSVCILPLLLKFVCGCYYAQKNKTLHAGLLLRSALSPVLLIASLVFYCTDFMTVTDGAKVYSMPLGANRTALDKPVTILILGAVLFAVCLITLVAHAVYVKKKYADKIDYYRRNIEVTGLGLRAYPPCTVAAASAVVTISVLNAAKTDYSVSVNVFGFLAIFFGVAAWIAGIIVRRIQKNCAKNGKKRTEIQ